MNIAAIFEATWNVIKTSMPETVIKDAITYETDAEKSVRLAKEETDAYSPQERTFYDRPSKLQAQQQLATEKVQVGDSLNNL